MSYVTQGKMWMLDSEQKMIPKKHSNRPFNINMINEHNSAYLVRSYACLPANANRLHHANALEIMLYCYTTVCLSMRVISFYQGSIKIHVHYAKSCTKYCQLDKNYLT